ncbi:hypothetical protein D3C81_654310 [compost metagenome]
MATSSAEPLAAEYELNRSDGSVIRSLALPSESLKASKLSKFGTAPVSALKSRGRRTSDARPIRAALSCAPLPTSVCASCSRLAMVIAPESENGEPSALLPLANTLLMAWLPICASITWLSTTMSPALVIFALAPIDALAVCSPSTKLIAPPSRNGAAFGGMVGVVPPPVPPPPVSPLSLPSAAPMPAPASDCAMFISPSPPLLMASTCS